MLRPSEGTLNEVFGYVYPPHCLGVDLHIIAKPLKVDLMGHVFTNACCSIESSLTWWDQQLVFGGAYCLWYVSLKLFGSNKYSLYRETMSANLGSPLCLPRSFKVHITCSQNKMTKLNVTENMSINIFEHVFICRSYYGKRQAIQEYNCLWTFELFILFRPLYILSRTTPMDSLEATTVRWEVEPQIVYEFVTLSYEHMDLIRSAHLRLNFHNTHWGGGKTIRGESGNVDF